MLARKMYSFPGAAVTNYHELVGLKQQDFLLLLFWGVWKSKIKVLARLVSLGASERESASSRSLVSGGGQKRLCSLGCGHVTAVSAPSILTLCCVCVCVCVHVRVSVCVFTGPSYRETTGCLDLGLTLIQCDLMSMNYMCK